MPSARAQAVRRLGCFAASALAAAGPLAGCTTTQHEAQRMQLDAARQRAAQLGTRVTLANPAVVATAVSTVTDGDRTAFVVTVSDRGRRAITDLPISVGYLARGGRRVYLNASAQLDYFQSHLPAIFPGRPRVWVYTADRTVPGGARPFALIGRRPSAPALLTETNVTIQLSWAYAAGGPVRVRLQNPTGVPQYQLQVYAYARRGNRYVAAANTTVTDLGAGSKQSLTLPLVGEPDGAPLALEAVPTILQ